MVVPFSSFPETHWPAIADPYSAVTLSVLFQLEQSQWWAPDLLACHQASQLKIVVDHAVQTVPFYRESFRSWGLNPSDALSPDVWRRIPLLQKRHIQLAGNTLHSNCVPKAHGNVSVTATSGSTGQPTIVMRTDFTNFLWRVFTLRDHFWHARRFELPFAAIKNTPDSQGLPPSGSTASTWGLSTQNLIPTGPCHLLSLRSTIEEQADWLRGVNPGYVLAYPSVLRVLAEVFESRGWRLPRLQSVTTFGEILEPQCRAACRRAFGVDVVDMYSSEEVGYIALQCPQHDHYHVQVENVLVEVLDEDGQACKPGMTGKVVVTTLHNFAMPLLRYDIGDFAEVGDPCPCGRGLPVLQRILGRHRNVLVLPSGERRSPTFSTEDLGELPSFFQFQIVQRTVEDIELNVVRSTASISPEEQATVEHVMQRALGYPCRVTIRCVDSIPRSPRGKFELFVSHVQ
jgi:phenylacetate-CoA ligase